MQRRYNGEIEWQIGEPPRSGYYLISLNGYVAEWKFYKDGCKSYWESYTESENDKYQRIEKVQAWAFLPKPFIDKTK